MMPNETRPVKRSEKKAPPVADPDDGKVHVRTSGVPIDPALCGRRGQTTISSASGWWGPDGSGWPDVCRECHRIERGLAEALPGTRGRA